MVEISKLLQNAKEASIKVFNQEEVTNEDLESIFKVVSYKKSDLWDTLSSNVVSIKDKLIKSVESAADVIIDYLYSTIVKDNIWMIFIQDILNNWDTVETLLNNPHSLLADDLKMTDEEAIKIVNNKIAIKIEKDLSSMEQSNFDSLDSKDLETIVSKLDNIQYLDDDLKDSIKILVSSALFGKATPELKKYSNDFSDAMKKVVSSSVSFIFTVFPTSKLLAHIYPRSSPL